MGEPDLGPLDLAVARLAAEGVAEPHVAKPDDVHPRDRAMPVTDCGGHRAVTGRVGLSTQGPGSYRLLDRTGPAAGRLRRRAGGG